MALSANRPQRPLGLPGLALAASTGRAPELHRSAPPGEAQGRCGLPTVKLVRDDRYYVICVDRNGTDSKREAPRAARLALVAIVEPEVIAENERDVGPPTIRRESHVGPRWLENEEPRVSEVRDDLVEPAPPNGYARSNADESPVLPNRLRREGFLHERREASLIRAQETSLRRSRRVRTRGARGLRSGRDKRQRPPEPRARPIAPRGCTARARRGARSCQPGRRSETRRRRSPSAR
jgi:hypothetical protein